MSGDKLKSVCIFPHFYDLEEVPYYVQFYLHQLEQHFDEIILVSNPRKLANLHEMNFNKVKIIFHENEGYDLGKFLKAFNELDLTKYKQIALINDSNILFGEIDFVFDWAKRQDLDFWGLISATIKPTYSKHEDNYHIQSHFMVFNQSAIPHLTDFLKGLAFDEIVKIDKVKEAKRRVINDWEIGLSQYMIKQNLKLAAYIQHASRYENSKDQFYQRMIKEGTAVIKKKVITSLLPKDLFAGKGYWVRLIKTYSSGDIDIPKLLKELYAIRKRYILRKIGF